jgi:nucleotide-binding universal stress UspA family protein
MATAIRQSRVRESSKVGETSERSGAPLLVATDASAPADAAVRAAQEISFHTGLRVKLLAVHEPLPLVAPEVQISETPSMEAVRRATLRNQVRDQLERVGIDGEWPLEVVSGDPAATIVNVAQNLGASLVIMGLGGHGLFDRMLGDEMVIKILRLGTVPVLAVAPDFTGLPTRVLAAVDFSKSSVRAVSLAAKLMNPLGTLTLAHVISRESGPASSTLVRDAFQGTLGRAFDLVVADIGAGKPETIERKILSGDPAKVLLALSDQIRPDLIVAGSHGHGFLTRLVLGSVSQRLVRGADCAVLVAPPEAGPSFLDELPEITSRFAAYEWAERLEEFTRRNAGRMATMEVIDPEIGAQIEEKGFRFVGAAFDARAARVQIMLGGPTLQGKHLTRSIGGATAIQVLRDRSGRDILLRVAHGRGQTLLTLER